MIIMYVKISAILTIILIITSLPSVMGSEEGSITYFDNPPFNPEYYDEYEFSSQFLEMLTLELDKILLMPEGVHVTTMLDECGVANAYYYPDRKRIVICYELVDLIEDFANAYYGHDLTMYGESIESVLLYIFFHEAGHMMINVFGLPVHGQEEDAVDSLAVIILIESAKEAQLPTYYPIYVALWYQFLTELGMNAPFWAEHDLNQQRMYDTFCLLYGSNPDEHHYLVAYGILPYERAQRCPDQYEKNYDSWSKSLEPHVIPEFGTIAVLITGLSIGVGTTLLRLKKKFT